MISEKQRSLDIPTDVELTEAKEMDRGTSHTTSIYSQVDSALSSNDIEQLRKLARLSALDRSRSLRTATWWVYLATHYSHSLVQVSFLENTHREYNSTRSV